MINSAEIAKFNRAAFCRGLIAEGGTRTLRRSTLVLRTLGHDTLSLSSQPTQFAKPETVVDKVRKLGDIVRKRLSDNTPTIPPTGNYEPNAVMKEVESNAVTIKPPAYYPDVLKKESVLAEIAGITQPPPVSTASGTVAASKTSTILPPASQSANESLNRSSLN